MQGPHSNKRRKGFTRGGIGRRGKSEQGGRPEGRRPFDETADCAEPAGKTLAAQSKEAGALRGGGEERSQAGDGGGSETHAEDSRACGRHLKYYSTVLLYNVLT